LVITREVANGSAKDVILDEAEKWGADLIVLGSHGYKGWRRFLLGSVSHAVATHARCSVEIVRRRGSGEDRGERIEGRRARVEDRGSRIEDRELRIEYQRMEWMTRSSILDPLSSIFYPLSGFRRPQ